MYIKGVSMVGRGAGWSSTRNVKGEEFQSIKCCLKDENTKVKRPVIQSVVLNFGYNFGRVMSKYKSYVRKEIH